MLLSSRQRFTGVLLTLFCLPTFANLQIKTIHAPLLITKARSLSSVGTLRQAKNGYVYLSVSPKFETELLPLYKKQFSDKKSVCLHNMDNPNGIHVSMFYPKANINQNLLKTRLGKTFHFHVQYLYFLSLKAHYHHMKVSSHYLALRVKSTELNRFMDQLIPHDRYVNQLHITLAVARVYQNRCLR